MSDCEGCIALAGCPISVEIFSFKCASLLQDARNKADALDHSPMRQQQDPRSEAALAAECKSPAWVSSGFFFPGGYSAGTQNDAVAEYWWKVSGCQSGEIGAAKIKATAPRGVPPRTYDNAPIMAALDATHAQTLPDRDNLMLGNPNAKS